MTTCLLQVSASSFGQQVTLSEKNVSLEKIFQLIRQQTGYDFLYDGKEIQSAKPVDVNFKNLDLRGALKKCLEDQGFEFEIGDKSVVVTKKTSSLIDRIAGALTNIDVRGRVTDESGNALPGAVIKVKGTNRSTSANDKGEFFLGNVDEKAVLIIAYVGYETREVAAAKDLGTVSLKLANNALEEVNVTVSTGYQTLPKERATGSFAHVDNKLLNRSVSTDILSRLDGVTSGLIFNKDANRTGFSKEGGDPGISIRGRSTLFANTEPLIILDNFPYDGDLSNINPNDIESVTVLKDAAAASIWGVRAGNGVIVLTSKKGKINQAPKISLNSNFTFSGKPDLYKVPQMTSKQYIEYEKFLFDNGEYDLYLDYIPTNVQSPVIDILEKIRKNPGSKDELTKQLNALGQIDTRDDFTKYFLRNSLNQQYALNVNGGSATNQYFISGGFDRNLLNQVSDSYNRFNLSANNSLNLLNSRLTLDANLLFTRSRTVRNVAPYRGDTYPYEQLVDQNGNALPVIRDFRQASKDELSNIGLLDWNYYPYNERLNNGNVSTLIDYRLGLHLNYKILPEILNFDVNYLFQQGNSEQNTNYDQSLYYTRLQINQFSNTEPSGTINYPVPLGSIIYNSNNKYISNSGRLQLNYRQQFGSKHEINAIFGTEIKDYNSNAKIDQLYGYNESTATSVPVNQFIDYQKRIGYTSRIAVNNSQSGTVDRFFSYFANGSYSFDKRYILSASARKDESNLFGVDANKKGVPLYSIGISWDISRENFYKFSLLPYLRLRLTDGYNGNLSKNLSAYTTAEVIAGFNRYTSPFQRIVNPPNPSLSWEKVHVYNVALDFGFKNNVIAGSVEYYSKKGLDLIGNSPVAPQTGLLQFTGNTADMLTKGLDVSLNSLNVNRKIRWTTNFLLSYVTDKITSYKLQKGINQTIVEGNYLNPIVGKPYSSIFSYKWSGLDDKGNPVGLLEGEKTADYAAILNSIDINNLDYIGTSGPSYFGNLRNNFEYKGFELSFNISYKLGYYFRRGSFSPLGSGGYKQADYNKRWQSPGDEKITNVPSLVYPLDPQRESFYNGSSVLIEKGDHIRLQDIQLTYTISNKLKNTPFKNFKIYGYVNNLGILWRANKLGMDPDYTGNGNYSIPTSKNWSIGLTAGF